MGGGVFSVVKNQNQQKPQKFSGEGEMVFSFVYCTLGDNTVEV